MAELLRDRPARRGVDPPPRPRERSPRRSLGPAKRRIDTAARMAIARELGHGRLEVASQYLGS